MRLNLARLHLAGAIVCNGTDSGGAITPTGCPHWEFLDMKRAGLSNLDILRSATATAAKTIGREDLGRIKAGAAADIILTRENPLNDISEIEDIVSVIRDGRQVF